MATFKDENGKEWSVRLSTLMVNRVREDAGVNLMDVLSPGDDGELLLGKLVDDVFVLGSVLWVLVREQADSEGITPEQFADRLRGQSLEDAGNAILDALEDFLPPKKSSKVKRFRQVAMEAAALTDKEVDAMLADLDPMTIHRQVMSGLRGSTDSPASSASTPAT